MGIGYVIISNLLKLRIIMCTFNILIYLIYQTVLLKATK